MVQTPEEPAAAVHRLAIEALSALMELDLILEDHPDLRQHYRPGIMWGAVFYCQALRENMDELATERVA